MTRETWNPFRRDHINPALARMWAVGFTVGDGDYNRDFRHGAANHLYAPWPTDPDLRAEVQELLACVDGEFADEYGCEIESKYFRQEGFM